MRAVILSAGYGTRMRPLTYYLNKGMIPLAGKPLLEHVINKLRKQGFTRLTVAVSHLHEQVEHYFGDGSRWGVELDYSISTEPLGTAGELWNLRDKLADEAHFLVHYGDIMTNLDAAAMAKQHLTEQAAATVGFVTNVRIHTGLGTMEGNRLTRFVEKPPLTDPCHAAMHIYANAALKYMDKGKDVATNVIPEMIAASEHVCGFLDPDAYWHDVGRLSDLDEAIELFEGGELRMV